MAEKLKPIGYFLGQLDTADYDGRGDMMKAARALRDAARRRIADDKREEKVFRDRQLTTSEKRGLVRAGTHRWCRGSKGCGGRGYLVGRDGVQLPHGPCRGDGLISVRGRRKGGRSTTRPRSRPTRPTSRSRTTRTRRHRGKKAAAGLVGLGTVWTVLGQTLGTVGQVVAVVVIVLVVLVRVLAYVLRGVAAVTS